MSCKYLLHRNPGLGLGKRRDPQSVSGFWATVSMMPTLCLCTKKENSSLEFPKWPLFLGARS